MASQNTGRGSGKTTETTGNTARTVTSGRTAAGGKSASTARTATGGRTTAKSGRTANSARATDRTNGKTIVRPATKPTGGDTIPFSSINYSAARIARERQKREYEQRKKEKLIFGLFVVIILVMILFAVLIFKRVLGDGEQTETEAETQSGVETSLVETSASDTDSTKEVESAYRTQELAKSDIYNGTLILIDASHPLRADSVTLEDIYESRTKFDKADSKNGYVYSFYPADKDVLLESETLAALNSMANDFYKATGNYDLFIHANAAYREGSGDEHATGRAFDLSVWTGGDNYYSLGDTAVSANFEWVRENYYKYGFIRHESACGSDRPYHFLYVGVAHSHYMYKNDLTLEGYWQLLRDKHAFSDDGKNNLAFTAEDGSRYEVYYVAADSDTVELPIPKNCEQYTVSGDNMGGFAVTVKLG